MSVTTCRQHLLNVSQVVNSPVRLQQRHMRHAQEAHANHFWIMSGKMTSNIICGHRNSSHLKCFTCDAFNVHAYVNVNIWMWFLLFFVWDVFYMWWIFCFLLLGNCWTFCSRQMWFCWVWNAVFECFIKNSDNNKKTWHLCKMILFCLLEFASVKNTLSMQAVRLDLIAAIFQNHKETFTQ